MELVKVKITNFRSIIDSGEFTIDDVTCLIGKNESGKSAILKALEGINSPRGFKYDAGRDYPRMNEEEYNRYIKGEDEEQDKVDSSDKVVFSEWKLNEEDIARVEKRIGQGVVEKGSLEITTLYQKKEGVGALFYLPIDAYEALKQFLTQYNLSASDKGFIKDCYDEKELGEKLKDEEDILSEELKKIKAAIKEPNWQPVWQQATDELGYMLPKFLYFSIYDTMVGRISVDNLVQSKLNEESLKPGDQLFLDLLEYAGTSLEEVAKLKNSEALRSVLRAASSLATNKMRRYWSQNKNLRLHITETQGREADDEGFRSGQIITVRVEDERYGLEVPFDVRSGGFVWFLSFLVHFSQVKKKYGNAIILLDEPGLMLHAKAQADLLEYINEQLKPDHQVIYTTHLPFMISPTDLSSTRAVEYIAGEDKNLIGTKVKNDIFLGGPETLFPLRAALGYEITQTLFIGENMILVEGISDFSYLKFFSNHLRELKRESLSDEWVIFPMGGIGNAWNFVSFFKGNNLNIVVIADRDDRNEQKREDLWKKKLLKERNVLILSDFCGKEEADIEDMFEKKFFVNLLNSAHDLSSKHKLSVNLLDKANKGTPRNAKKAQSYFDSIPKSEKIYYKKYKTAHWLEGNPSFLKTGNLSGDVSASLDRFENLFKAINKLLEK